MHNLKTLYRYRDLLWLWTAREVRVRYKQSLLGMAWAVLQPLALTLMFTAVFSRLVKVDTGGIPYPMFAYAALVPWTFLATALSFGIPSLVNNMSLVTKIYFPREILPMASIGAAFLDLLVASAIFGGMMAFYHIGASIRMLWVIPLLVLQVTLTLGVTLIGSTVIVFFRDMRFVVPLLIQIWMYATPVIYPVDLVPPQFQSYYFLNPMASIIDGYRRVLLMDQDPLLSALALGGILSVLLLGVGYVAFKRAEPVFADVI